MRAIWSGTISFGLVNIPVNIQTAVKTDSFSMNYLRKDDLCPIQYKRVCRRTGEEVPYEDIIRGYEYEKGDYVVLDDKDFQKAAPKKSYSIDIEEFVNEREVDLKYVEKPYYLEPAKKTNAAAYALFRNALRESNMVGIGRFILRDREHLVMLKPDHDVILLIVMRFPDTVQPTTGLNLPKTVEVPRSQKELALELINKMKSRFKPKDLKDTYAERLSRIIEAKKHGKTVHVEKEAPTETAAADIMDALRRSLTTVH